MTRLLRLRALRAGAIALAFVAAGASAQVRLDNAWLRPAYAGQPAAMVYVDIRANEALTLVAARSAAADGAELVLVEPPGAPVEQHRVVTRMPVTAGGLTRLAMLGSHVRLTGVRQDLHAGMSIPLELTFVDAQGARRTLATEAVVRGIGARRADDPPTSK